VHHHFTDHGLSPGLQAPAATVPVPCTVHRRPVVTLDGHVVGYSVRVSVEARAVPTPRVAASPAELAATAERLHAAYLDLDLPNLVADRYVFLPATPQMLEGFVPTAPAPGRMVLTLPTGFEHLPDAGERSAALQGLGMQLALDDYRGEPAQQALLPHVAFVVVRPGAAPLAPLVHHVHRVGVTALAADVMDLAAENECRAAGVDAIGGSQAERSIQTPPGASEQPTGGARVLRAGEAQCLALMHLLHEPEVEFGKVSQVIDTDPVLTLRVLNLVNSGAFALRNQIDTVTQATVLLGARELTTLVSALMVDARPDAMDSLWLILARALTCEALAQDSTAYTIGMMSALAEQLSIPVTVILEKVGVSEVVADAIQLEAGPLGQVLAAVRAHERADTLTVITAGLQPEEVSDVYMQAVSDALATARAVTRAPGA
jgi:c-di-GMP-related signal transduction protein